MDCEKNVSRKLNLYHKEQLVLITLLLCFVLSGIGLPTIREKYMVEASIGNEVLLPEQDSEDRLEDGSEVDSKDIISEDSTEDSMRESSDKTPDEAPDKVPNETPDEVPGETSNSPESQKPIEKPSQKPGSGSPSKDPNPSTTPDPQPKPETPTEPEKEWVPPVYEIVHHEAVYETVRLVVCNYCSEQFNTVGEFQVHKDANGG